MKKEELKGKVAVLMGACGGIGQEIAKLFDKEGIALALGDIDEGSLKKISKDLKQEPFTLRCDVTNKEQVKTFYSKTLEKYQKIDFLVNTVGIIIPGLFENTTYEDIEKQINVNLMGAIICTKEIIPIMKEQNQGHVITISSLAGIVPETYSSIYTATKFALRGLDWTLALELKEYDIKVSTIFPDSVDTPMLEYEAKHGGSPLTFLHDPVPPEEVAEGVLKAILKDKIEVCVPKMDGILSKIIMCLPSQVKRIWPKYEKKGEKKKQAFLKKVKETNL
ncbi:MAG: SDR family NAD(P)-dependent oxidoreductase [Candidatus Lokiarchaeota archaeon]|nr:SDR family NAD(P)-dependent oxidoreductase [Candidatus Lokiarchaeota archaeon]MBD3199512.1 SDR family NAD(P)-dependent oxidoreductase [Candidatus Lokiarchaeota archaeon]